MTDVTKIQECCLCQGDIEQKRTETGEVYWSSGNNPEPLGEGRCCDTCNITKVIPARMREMLLADKPGVLSEVRQRWKAD